ncbi:hypothetical protein F4801DRAFT_576463 [Xylaria longipes]|nr:hypothetical protein F4801DRAFT_576463 [Xylaria longipes]
MAAAVIETIETKVLVPRMSIVTSEDISYSTHPSTEIPVRDYPTTRTANLSYYQSTSTTPGLSPTSLTTIVISKTATFTLTTVALITSESTITTVAPLSAPLLSSKPASIVLSPGKIIGIVVGAVVGLLIFVLLFYLLLTRAKWLIRFANYRLERKEKEHRRKKPRLPKRTKQPAENTPRSLRGGRRTSDRRKTEPNWTAKTRPPSITLKQR